MEKFEINKEYGNDLTIKVISRTEKTITFESVFGVKRCRVKAYISGVECVFFKSWIITANEYFDKLEVQKISYEKAYY